MTEFEWVAATDPTPMIELLRGRGGHMTWHPITNMVGAFGACRAGAIGTQRKWTLYLCAGLRQIWDKWLYSDRSWKAVEVAERMAEGAATEEEIRETAYYAETPTFGYDFVPSHVRQGLGRHQDIKRLITMGVFREEDVYGPGTARRMGGEHRLRQIKGVDCDEYDDPDFAEVFSYEQIGDPDVVAQLLNAATIAEGCLCGLRDWVVNCIPRQRDWPGGWLIREIFGNPFRPVAVDPAWRTEVAVGIARGIYEDPAFERMPILADALQDAGCEDAEVLAHCREPGTHVRGCWAVDLVLGKS